MVATTTRVIDAIRALTEEVGQTKRAAQTKVSAEKNPDGTSHPSGNVDDNTQNSTEGSRSSENTADVKADIPAAVDSAAEVPNSEQDKVQLNIGLTQSATGDDSSVEDNYKDKKDDDGFDGDTSHPAKADTGEKYSCSIKVARANVARLANDILADLANGYGSELNKKAAAAPKTAPAAPQKTAAAVDPKLQESFEAGYKLAADATNQQAVKQAAYNTLHEACGDAIRACELVFDYLTHYEKSAADTDDEANGEDHSAPGDESSGAGDTAPASGGESSAEGGGSGGAPPSGGGGGTDIAALLGGAAGGSPTPGGDPMGGAPMGGDPGMGGAPMGGDPMGGGAPGMGGDPMGGGAPGMGGPANDDAIMQLVAALEELGIPLDQLMAAGGEGQKIASACKAFKLSGKYEVKEATGKMRQLRNQMKNHVRELLSL